MTNICTLSCFEINLDNIEKISTIIIALLTLVLAYYVFVYQRAKDKKDRKIQWFKELIIQPKLKEISAFFDFFNKLRGEFKSTDLSEEEKIKIINDIKKQAADFRRNFLSIIQNITPELFKNIQDNIDTLIDELTKAISNDELKLNHEKTYEREISQKVQESYRYILQQIFEYNG